MPKVKTTYAYKIRSIVKEFPDDFVESINKRLYCNLCNCAVSCNKRFLIDSHRNTSKHHTTLGNKSENLIPQTSQTFLRSSDTDFVERSNQGIFVWWYSFVQTKQLAYWKAHSWHWSQIAIWNCLMTNSTASMRNAAYDNQIFLIDDKSTLSGTQYLKILVGSL